LQRRADLSPIALQQENKHDGTDVDTLIEYVRFFFQTLSVVFIQRLGFSGVGGSLTKKGRLVRRNKNFIAEGCLRGARAIAASSRISRHVRIVARMVFDAVTT
ncbi:hypothetical protein U1Q18_051838, partial [Sarracenia purpurea var. burkii]